MYSTNYQSHLEGSKYTFDSHCGTNTYYRIKQLSKFNQLKASRSEHGLALAQMRNCTEFCQVKLNIT